MSEQPTPRLSKPGPWTATHRQEAECRISGFWHVSPTDAPAVAYVMGSEIDARLVAAAPDLLDELSGAPCFGCGVRFGDTRPHRQMEFRGCLTCSGPRAAIAKALTSPTGDPS